MWCGSWAIKLRALNDEDVEPQDTEYADVLFACTKNLVRSVPLKGRNPLLEWMQERWQSLKDLAVTEVAFDKLSFEQQISQFSKITASVRAVPDIRRELRKRLNDSTPSLLVALNSFIAEARAQMPASCKGLVVIADNLDRIAENKPDGRSNFDEIYLNRSELMRGMDCHVIYTVPIQMIYSPRVTRLEDNYGKPDILPMVMVKALGGEANEVGVNTLKEIICRRLQHIDPALPEYIDSYVFDSAETRRRLCVMSGGHMRVLMQLLQRSIDWIEELPITAEAAQAAIEERATPIARRFLRVVGWLWLARTTASNLPMMRNRCCYC